MLFARLYGLKEVGFTIQKLIQIFCDNISSIMLAKNLVFHAKTKRIEVYYDYVSEKVIEGVVNLKYIKTKYQIADILTKALPNDRFFNF